jgi:hypothetical protein
MPVEHGYEIIKGKKFGYYRWGESGKKYLHQIGNERSRKIAHEKAWTQGKAIKRSQSMH